MNKTEFEQAVRELRTRQKRFFRCRKDDPDREKAKKLMREQEQIVWPIVDAVMATRPIGKNAESKREEFFLAVAEMKKRQIEWMKSPGYYNVERAHAAEKEVDKILRQWDEEKEYERKRASEEELKRQTTLF